MTMLATHLSEELVGNRSIEREWGQKIVAAWQQSVTGILECGRLLIQAKAALTHGRRPVQRTHSPASYGDRE
jgi:hypothetical protein